jgi:hypothetical protein
MDTEIIREMVGKLKPVITDQRRAEQLLDRYWRDKIAVVWSVEHVHRAANEVEVALTKAEAVQLLQHFHHIHNRQYGLRWSDVTSYIQDQVLGRKLTKQEINRFVKQDIITVK